MKHDVQHPVQSVLDVPVAAHVAGEQAGVEVQGAQEVAALQAGRTTAFHLGFHHGDGANAGEVGPPG